MYKNIIMRHQSGTFSTLICNNTRYIAYTYKILTFQEICWRCYLCNASGRTTGSNKGGVLSRLHLQVSEGGVFARLRLEWSGGVSEKVDSQSTSQKNGSRRQRLGWIKQQRRDTTELGGWVTNGQRQTKIDDK